MWRRTLSQTEQRLASTASTSMGLISVRSVGSEKCKHDSNDPGEWLRTSLPVRASELRSFFVLAVLVACPSPRPALMKEQRAAGHGHAPPDGSMQLGLLEIGGGGI
jgi:hypothetical protein